MARIIAGKFDTQREADAALAALSAAGLQTGEYGTFYLGPAGQHDLQPGGGDTPHHSEGTKHAGKTAATGSAIGGVTGLALGTVAAAASEPGFTAVAAVAGAAVGAYAGSLAGGLAGSRQDDPQQTSRQEPSTPRAGIMVAICVDREGTESRAIDTLRAQGAREIQRAEGQWQNGAWSDFDASRTPQLIERT
jgi:hypothetical protein